MKEKKTRERKREKYVVELAYSIYQIEHPFPPFFSTGRKKRHE
jgi:hypothetical protein